MFELPDVPKVYTDLSVLEMDAGLMNFPKVITKTGRGQVANWLVKGEVARDCDYIQVQTDGAVWPRATRYLLWGTNLRWMCWKGLHHSAGRGRAVPGTKVTAGTSKIRVSPEDVRKVDSTAPGSCLFEAICLSLAQTPLGKKTWTLSLIMLCARRRYST